MDEMVFLGTLIVLLVAGLLWAKAVIKKQSGRKPNHPIYHETSSKQPSHRPASHTLVHSHSTDRIHAKEDIWHGSRLKSNEAHWESGTLVANKILTDSELAQLALENREPEQGHGVYKPANISRGPARAAGKTPSRR